MTMQIKLLATWAFGRNDFTTSQNRISHYEWHNYGS